MHAGNYKPESYTGAYQYSYSVSSVTKTTRKGDHARTNIIHSLSEGGSTCTSVAESSHHALSSESSSSDPMVLDSKVVLIGPEVQN